MTKLQELRKQRGYNLRELAKLTGISKTKLEQVEKGKQLVTNGELERLAKALGTTKEELIND